MSFLLTIYVDESPGKRHYKDSGGKFQTTMGNACFADCPTTCVWCLCQSSFIFSGCTQYLLRSRVLDGDMSKYRCFQGQFTACCCIKAGTFGEESCPQLCLCCEACCCPGLALSASRITVMDQYDLSSDPCDNRMIRFSNCCMMLSCVCHILAIFIDGLDRLAQIIDLIADIVFAVVSGCMTAQVIHELNYQKANGGGPPVGIGEPISAPATQYKR